MNTIIAWFARNHVASNLLMGLLIVGGLATLPGLEQRIFPEISLEVIDVEVAYPGAAPSEVEDGICTRIEQALQGLEGIKRIRATASEGIAQIAVELQPGEDPQKRLDDIRARVDALDTLPDEAERPVVRQTELRMQVLNVAVSGDVDERTLKQTGERVRDEIAALPGITDAVLSGARRDEIAIEVSNAALLRHGLSFDDVVAAIERSSLDLPGGSLRADGGEIRLRTRGQARSGGEFAAIGLVSRADGTRLALGDVAHVRDGFEESDQRAFLDGEPAVMVEVFRVGDQSALEISKRVRGYVERTRANLPEGIALTAWQDDSRILRDRLSTLLRNARGGLILVGLVLALFLRLRLAGWVSLGIPISFIGAIWCMPLLGVDIDMISLTAFIIVLGIVVDDAIVVGESVHRAQTERGDRLEAAIEGTTRIAMPVIFGVLTTMIAFSPLLFVSGTMGTVARIIPSIVILCLLFSLVESLFVLPSHLGQGTGALDPAPRTRLARAWKRLQDAIAARLDAFIQSRYLPFLERCLRWRYVTASVAMALLIVTAGVVGGGWVRFTFQPEVEGDTMVAFLTLPAGTPADTTRGAVGRIEGALDALRAELAREGQPERIRHVATSIGEQPYRIKQAQGPSAFLAAGRSGSHLAEVRVEVAEGQGGASITALTHRWRALTGEVIGAVELSFNSSLATSGKAIDLQLAGGDLAALEAAADQIETALRDYPGVHELGHSLREGQREIEIELLPSAEALGLSAVDLARQVRQAFYGHEVQRVQRGRDDVAVVVRYPADERRSIADLEAMRIRTRAGAAVPFGSVAHATLAKGPASIQRIDRERVANVTGSVDTAAANANEILADFRANGLPAILDGHPGIAVSFEGEQREQREFVSTLARGWMIALLAIYAILAIPLRSYAQPLIIMSAIPFGLIGAIAGHWLTGHDFSMFSLLGFVALSGVVVNDSLVFVDHVNQERAGGAGLRAALRHAGRTRFRAILLTSLTTFAGLTPLMLEQSPQSKLLIPMAISLAFGVVFATAITLVLVPTVYAIIEDLAAKLEGTVGDREPAHAAPASGAG